MDLRHAGTVPHLPPSHPPLLHTHSAEDDSAPLRVLRPGTHPGAHDGRGRVHRRARDRRRPAAAVAHQLRRGPALLYPDAAERLGLGLVVDSVRIEDTIPEKRVVEVPRVPMPAFRPDASIQAPLVDVNAGYLIVSERSREDEPGMDGYLGISVVRHAHLDLRLRARAAAPARAGRPAADPGCAPRAAGLQDGARTTDGVASAHPRGGGRRLGGPAAVDRDRGDGLGSGAARDGGVQPAAAAQQRPARGVRTAGGAGTRSGG